MSSPSAERTLTRPEQATHMVQLDALRGLAVIAVFIHHTPVGERFPIPLGGLGVRLFFVLSGFLITGILLRSRATIDRGEVGAGISIRQFYIRRFLRIFPLYYFVIGCVLLLDFGGARHMYGWLLTYTVNLQLAMLGEWHALSHFWSLAVEEHFYLVWPWIVLFAPRKLLWPTTIAAIVMGPLYRAYAIASGFNYIAVFCHTLSCLDTLGLGALLALRWHCSAAVESPRLGHAAPENAFPDRTPDAIPTNPQCPTHGDRQTPPVTRGIVLRWGAAGYVLCYLTSFFGGGWDVASVFQDLCVGVCFVWLIDRAARGFGGIWGSVLEWKPLIYIGKMSYGIYVYHVFAPYLLKATLRTPVLEERDLGVAGWLLTAFVSIIMAALSWHLMEQPINNLRRLFPYAPSQRLERQTALAPAAEYR